MSEGRFKVVSVNISPGRGTGKRPVGRIVLKSEYGIVGDAHAGSSRKQVSFLAMEDIDRKKEEFSGLNPGDFAENITTEGIDLLSFPVGARFNIDEVEFEVTQIGKPGKGHTIKGLRTEPLLVKRGLFARVIKGGVITDESIGSYDI
ncbi:MAG: MOSC domain-containing protein [Candidatus Krumholzibacteriota bacterium]|nr:MOSC domain-containing protein [Candidatus Krumholzibacteriota bacterium]